MVNQYIISALFMLLGNIVAVIVPYLRKQYLASLESKSFEFDFMYLYKSIVAVIVTFASSLPVLAIMSSVSGFTNILGLILVSFAYGFGGNKLGMEGAKVINLVKTIMSQAEVIDTVTDIE